MPDADTPLSSEEERELVALVGEAKAWASEAADRSAPAAVASALILAALEVYEDTFGTEAVADMLRQMGAAADAKVQAGPPERERH